MFDYDPNKVMAIIKELEGMSSRLSANDLAIIATIREFLENGEEIPKNMFVSLSMLRRKVR